MQRHRSNPRRRTSVLAALLLTGALAVPAGATPANDDFANATTIGSLPWSTSGLDTTTATLEDGEAAVGSDCDAQDDTVWFTYTAATDQRVVFTTVGSTYTAVLEVFTGTSLAELSRVGCSKNAYRYFANLPVDVTAGTTYHVRASSPSTNQGGSLTLNAWVPTVPPNDDFDAAATLGPAPSSASVEASLATGEGGEPTDCAGGNTDSVWWRHTPDADGVLVVSTFGSDFDTALGVYAGASLASLVLQACNNNMTSHYYGGRTSEVEIPVVAATTYLIRVSGYGSADPRTVAVSLEPGTPAAGALAGTLNGRAGVDETPSGVCLQAWDTDPALGGSAAASAVSTNGSFSVSGLAGGEYRLRIVDTADECATPPHHYGAGWAGSAGGLVGTWDAAAAWTVTAGTTTPTGAIDIDAGYTNAAPTAVPDTYDLAADQAATLDVLTGDGADSDPDGDELALAWWVSEAGATVTAAGGLVELDASGTALAYTPAAGYEGPDSFDYAIEDGHGATSTTTVTLTVTAAPDPGPSPSPTPTDSATPTPTESASPTPTESASPEPTPTATTSPEPTATPTTAAGGGTGGGATSGGAGTGGGAPAPTSDPTPEPTPTTDPTPEPTTEPPPEPTPTTDPTPQPSATDGAEVLGLVVTNDVTRLAGAGRVETAAAVSAATFVTAPTAVLARADGYADALAGAPLATSLGGPMLLTGSDGLHDAAADELRRLGVERVVLLGGVAALSDRVRADVAALGVATERIAGSDRFETAARVAAHLGGTTAYLVEGASLDPLRGWPDAVSAASVAAAQGRPILLTTRDELPGPTLDALRAIDTVTVVGGRAAVSDEVVGALVSAGIDTRRIAGASRYATSRAVADAHLGGATPPAVWVATGRNYPDALAAGPAVAASGGVLVLVDGADPDAASDTRSWLADLDWPPLVVVGGRGAVSDEVVARLREAP